MLAVLHGCKHKDGQVPPEENTTEVGKVVISEMKQVVSKTLSARGGEVGIQDAESSLNGFKITVPDGAYTGGAEFSVSTAKVVRQNFGDEYKVLSPLISIAAPSGNSDDLITIEVPINLPNDHFAAAVFINEEGKPDLLPMVSLSEKNIVLAVNSFKDNAFFKEARTSSLIKLEFLIVGILDITLLSDNYSTAFEVGKDNWSFTNFGSIVAPKGYCNGASFSSLWYFNSKKESTGRTLSTYGAASNPPATLRPEDAEQLNASGIKYVSLMQGNAHDMNFIAAFYQTINYMNPIESHKNKIAYIYAAFCLKITGKPLYLTLIDRNNLSHFVLIVGKINNELEIADPNFPKEKRKVVYDPIKRNLLPYNSGSKADVASSYSGFMPLSYSSFSYRNILSSKWQELENGNIGHDKFPDFMYTIKTIGKEVTKTTLNQAAVNKIVCPFQIGISSIASQPRTKAKLINDKGKVIEISGNSLYNLPGGRQKIGILVSQDVTYENKVYEDTWADFRWFDIEVISEEQDFKNCQITTGEGISIEKAGETDKEYAFSLGATCSFPPKTVFFWDFGDGNTDEAVDKQTAKHKFSKVGDFTIRLRALPPGASDYIAKELKIRILPQYFVRFTVGSNEYLVPKYTGDAISFSNHTYGIRRESWPSLLAIYDDRKGSQSYSAFLSIDFYNNAFKGVGDYTIAAPLNEDIMLSPYASRTEFYASLPSKGPVLNAYITSTSGSSFLGKSGGNVKITKYEKGSIIEGTFEFVGDEYIKGLYTVRNQPIKGSFRVRPQFDN
ncbi:hypothetical protein GCM10023091_36940 [Ravibacter arvi]|uniref:PKD domain-containing protein n=1 Tax=Ravibacter arvi TaxID=2051041 RepID=A0ABP8M9P2_9BACT